MDHPLASLLSSIGPEVEDPEEESFLLFAQDIPSDNLGFVDSRAPEVDVTIHDQDFTISQSPTLLSSSRAGGTTGAVLWKITPLIAEWLSAPSNPLTTSAVLNPTCTILELGCGISGLIALALAPCVQHFVATDQEYVHRLVRRNLESNAVLKTPSLPALSTKPALGRKKKQSQQSVNRQKGVGGGGGGATAPSTSGSTSNNITFAALDWETDVPASLKASLGLELSDGQGKDQEGEEEEEEEDQGFDLLVSCDCIYNDALIAPFVRTCADFARLRPAYSLEASRSERRRSRSRSPTVCLIAQQQRSPEVFEAWLKEAMKVFRVWRVGDEVLGSRLRLGTGYLVHLLVLRGDD